MLLKKSRSSLVLVTAMVASVTLQSCSSQTRLGYLIPAHRNSDASDGEVVRVNFYPDARPPVAPEDRERAARESALAASAAVYGAKLAVDFVSSELEKEAKRYEAQFAGRAIAPTDQLGRAGYLIVERWVDPRMLNAYDGTVPDDVRSDYERMAGTCQQLHDADVATGNGIPRFADLPADPSGSTKGKLLAFLFVARIEPAVVGGQPYRSGPFAITPQLVWVWKTKAKVVDLSLSESWKIWQWIGALALKTENKANVKVEVLVKALSADKKSGTGVVDVNTSAPIVAQLQVNLSEPKLHHLSAKSGIWFDVPRYWSSDGKTESELPVVTLKPGIGRTPESNTESASGETKSPAKVPDGVGFALFDVVVSDSDASNVRTVLESGAKKLKENKDGIADSVGKIFE